MTIFLAIILFILGLVLAVIGADMFIRSARWFADVTGLSKAVVGATIIAFATSGPEFFVSLFASLNDNIDIATGNIWGSCIVNLGVAFTLIAVCRPHKNEDKQFIFNAVVLFEVMIFIFVICLLGAITILHAIILAITIIIFTFINIKYCSTNQKQTKKPTNKKEIALSTAFFIVGIVGLIFGSSVAVNNAETIALEMGISQYIIGITIVAIGTSLPEILTTIIAIAKKENGMSIGNIIGSNIFNLTAVLSGVVLTSTTVNPTWFTTYIDLPFMITMSAVAIVPTLITKKFYRAQGIIIACIYIGYIATAILVI